MRLFVVFCLCVKETIKQHLKALFQNKNNNKNMYTAHFVNKKNSFSIRRVRCTDGIVRALATDIFRAVNSSNKKQ